MRAQFLGAHDSQMSSLNSTTHHHRSARQLVVLTFAIVGVLAACGGDASPTTTSAAEVSDPIPTTDSQTTDSAASATTVSSPPSTITPTTADTPQFAGPLPPTAQLVFQTDQIMISDVDGGASIEPAAPAVPGGQEHPDWAPDGRHIVFDTDFAQLWTASTTGDDPEMVFDCVAPCSAVYDGAWSPDGEQIAFAMAETEDGVHTSRASIAVLNVATRDVHTLYSDESGVVWIFQPRWSPDASQLVFDEATFASNRLDEGSVISERIAVANASADAEPVRYLTDPADGAATTPDWASTGDLIVFVRDSNLVTIRPDGRAETQVTDFDGVSEHAIQPTFLPDGSRIVFTHVTGTFGVDDVPAAAVIALDGSRPTDLPLGAATHVRVNPASV